MNLNVKGRGRKSSLSANNNNDNEDHNNDTKRKMHREIERQRRQEMSNHFASLRSILPAQYIKGKRSISDHIAEFVNYIKDTEKNVKELGEKRDQLKLWEASSSTSTPPGNVVIIHSRLGGSELEISISHRDDAEEFTLSSALKLVLDEQGLDVVSCTSAKINERLIHNIQCQVSEKACIDINRLKQKLVNLGC